ncbi:TIGR00725 family protein [Spirilliplanes yamanashiensis]|uniref:TIGR00725 family protein n=1 Tax=Spirilliplanes yamanashiensis TaxID=42233 RepID=A0A8J3Y9S3_9ACTN|nr:TIGR00725 family protein [Spirilliplanes yamanashiensis]MDP9817831.1 uncharacterized protein (TIGR00725 family) [Spirilliplanes yamanashiensis]GIJ04641.1 hypothetical protein Sya03_39930 [Spirilliplanes yamanashiensis]
MTYVAVAGPGDAPPAVCAVAEEVGALLARRGAIVVCGGLGGVMAAACRGAAAHGGTTVGLLPGDTRAGANPHLTVALPTGLGQLRNGLVVAAADALIAVGGNWGTLSEVALAARAGKPVAAVGGWTVSGPDGPVDAAVTRCATAAEAVAAVLP